MFSYLYYLSISLYSTSHNLILEESFWKWRKIKSRGRSFDKTLEYSKTDNTFQNSSNSFNFSLTSVGDLFDKAVDNTLNNQHFMNMNSNGTQKR